MSYLVCTVANPNYSYMQLEYPSPEMLSTRIELIFFQDFRIFYMHNPTSGMGLKAKCEISACVRVSNLLTLQHDTHIRMCYATFLAILGCL